MDVSQPQFLHVYLIFLIALLFSYNKKRKAPKRQQEVAGETIESLGEGLNLNLKGYCLMGLSLS
jgi:hypothetical protein